MNKTLKQSDLNTIKRWLENEPIAQIFKAVKDLSGLNVGDIFVKRDLSNNEIVKISGMCKVPRKYKVVYVDEYGIPWFKQVSVRGGLGDKIYPLTHFNPTRFQFELDPEKLDADLLGTKYDPRIEYKRMRDANPNYGKKK